MRLFPLLLVLVLLLSACHSGGDQTAATADSLQLLKDSIKANPKNADAWVELYQAQLTKNDSTGAIRSLEEYLSLFPNDESAGLELAWLMAYKKDSSTLELTQWLGRSKNAATVTRSLYILSHYYANMGKTADALTALNQVIEQNYQFIDAHIQKGILLFDTQQYTDALHTFMLGLKIEPSNPDLYYWIGETHKALGHNAEAEDWQKKYEALSDLH